MGDATALDPLWGGAATVTGMLGTVVVGAHFDHGPTALLYRLGCWIGAGGWLTYTLITTPWNLNTFAALGVGALTAGLLSPLGRVTPHTDRRPGTALVLRQNARIGIEWENRLLRVCRIRVTVTDVVTWPTGTGYDVQVELPGGGVTRKQVESYAEALATDARLPEGCGVEIVGGPHRGTVVLRVSTVNRLAQIITYPADYSPTTVLEPIYWGEYTNADPAGALVREESVLIAGKRGSGKTTLLQDASIALGRCTDNLVWHLDLNGGGLTQPWIDVWLDGRVARCPIDWAAPNLHEGKLMLSAAIAVAKHRKASYRQLKRAHNSNLLPVSPELPQITILVDEGAQAVKDRELESLLSELQNIGRNEAVNLIISALRPTSDLIPVNMKKQTGVRIQMHGPDDDELGHMFGWNRGICMDQLAGKGTGFASLDGSVPRPFRAYNVLPAQIEQAALIIATTRPDLDAASAEAAGEAYDTRYQRMYAAFTDLDTTEEVPDPYAHALNPGTSSAPVPARRLTVLPGGRADSWADPFALARRTSTPLPVVSAADWPEPRRQVARARQLHPVPAALQPHQVPPIVARAMAAFAAAGTERLHSAELADALGMSQTELADALRPYGIGPREQPFKRRGQRLRGYDLEDFHTAAEGHTPGSQPGATPGHTAV
ncbi:hypothetical protein [Planobispora longispora]|uniref:FtsK domain-containing protein n=1 Tax=Planobispora longispora TaxID=28887 RepID=A0A8J3RUZ8_9ACTN|nr:hypothetical protein [Planobispora longispora]GIH81190.1 hypothetical protein Plo01_76190 [Planobispora longispora]